jgi:hypothetical protein
MTCDSLAGSFNLASRNPALLERLNAERSESKLIAPLGVSLHSSFLRSSVFGPLRL